MNNKRLVLLKALLLSTSRVNKMRYANDKKVKNKAVGAFIGIAVVYAMIVAYSALASVGYGIVGLGKGIPAICAAALSLLAFVFTFFKTNGYLFNFKEYDMLMALPFEPKTIAADKFLYMYLLSLPWYVSISLPMMIGYGIFVRPNPLAYLMWVIMTFFLPLIPMLFAAFLGFLIAKVSTGFKKKNIIQTVLTFIFVIFCFSLQYIIDAFVKSDEEEAILSNISDVIASSGNWYLPLRWFNKAIINCDFVSFLLLIASSAILFEVLFLLVGKNYRKINSALKAHASGKAFQMAKQKKSSPVKAVAFKEFKRLTASNTYMVNGAMGEVLAFLLGIVVLIFGFDKIVGIITKGAPIDYSILQPAIPIFVYFFIGMVATTACSPSLEGKNYWIVQSLPLSKKALYQGKMLFNLCLTLPFAIFSTLCFCISAKVAPVEALLYLVEIAALCAFSTCWGCVCGIRHMKLEWENEIEVVKQGAAVSIYLLPNMFAAMGLMVLVVVLGLHMSAIIISLIITAIALGLASLCYFRALALGEKR